MVILDEQIIDPLTALAEKYLKGRTIVEVRYMDPEEAAKFGWYNRPLLLILDDGTVLIPSQDYEMNDGGALFGVGTPGTKKPLVFPPRRF